MNEVLNSDTRNLINQTILFAQNAYAPYSNFKVSAGILLESGKTVYGTNVENASYPAGICAERTALSHAISNYPTDPIRTIAIYVDKDLKEPVPPCGICRQSLVEAEQRQKKSIEILLVSTEGLVYRFKRSADLLPLSFGANFL